MSRLPYADPLAVGLSLALIVAVGCAAALGWFCYRLLVDRGNLLLRLPGENGAGTPPTPRGLPAGSFVSDFALPRLNGSMATLTGLLSEPLLLVFVRGDCLFSRTLLRELAKLDRGSEAPLPVVVVAGEIAEAESLSLSSQIPGPVLWDRQGQVARLMRVAVTPAGYHIDRKRRTDGPLLAGPTALLALARGEAEGAPAIVPLAYTPIPKEAFAAPAPLAPGDPAPRFTLPTTDGAPWALATHVGVPFGLVFTDPGCPPCQTLLAELRRREATGIVLVSRGDPDENRRLSASLGPAAPVVVQQNREVARAYRTLETPAAYLIDERGAIAAGPAIGTEQVLALVAGVVPVTGIEQPAG